MNVEIKCGRFALFYSQIFGCHSIPRSFVCAGAKLDVDTCKGDGGGPLACKEPGTDNIYVQVRVINMIHSVFLLYILYIIHKL